MIGNSRSENVFQYEEGRPVQKTMQDLSHQLRTGFNFGQLIPFVCEETLPGDEWQISWEIMTRFNPLYFPIMHRINLKAWWFYVPLRIIYPNWKSFIENYASSFQQNVLPTIDVNMQDVSLIASGVANILVHLGFPPAYSGQTILNQDMTISAFQYAVYLKVYNDFFINPIIQEYEEIQLIDGDNTGEQWFLNNWVLVGTNGNKWRNWNRDFYTSATVMPQSGVGIRIPLLELNADGTLPTEPILVRSSTTGTISSGTLSAQAGNANLVVGTNTDVYPDLNPHAGTIQSLRYATSLQELLEKQNRAGGRYRDMMKALWGRDPMSGVIDFAEYLGTASAVVQISDVMQTANTEIGETQYVTGEYAGKALAFGESNSMRYNCQEHGYIIGIVNMQPRTSYFQGVPKMFTRSTWFDFALDDFARIGDQEIERREFVMDYGAAFDADDNIQTWGYIPRYSEYRFRNDRITGIFALDEFLDWHLARVFDQNSIPDLNSDFIEASDQRTNDIFVKSTGDPDVLAWIWNDLKVWRPIPKYGIPQL